MSAQRCRKVPSNVIRKYQVSALRPAARDKLRISIILNYLTLNSLEARLELELTGLVTLFPA